LIVTPSTFVITVSGVSGAGKSSTVRAVADLLGNASCFYFDDYGEAMQQPADGLRWIAAGADLAEFVLPQFGADIRRLKQGEMVITPTHRRVEPAAFLVVEEPFGRGRKDMHGLVDFSVCLDIPLEIALARRLLDVVERWDGTAEQRLQWMNGYLRSYLFEGMSKVYIAINEQVKANAELILDATLPVGQNAQAVFGAIRAIQTAIHK
jgi:uridine kinase